MNYLFGCWASIHKTCWDQILSQVLSFGLKSETIFSLKLVSYSQNSLVSDLVSNLRLVHSCLKYFVQSLKHYFILTEIHIFYFFMA